MTFTNFSESKVKSNSGMVTSATSYMIIDTFLDVVVERNVHHWHCYRMKSTAIDMSHFSYACRMRYPLNLVLENCEYLWFYLTFWIAILDCDLKLHKLSIHTLVMLQK